MVMSSSGNAEIPPEVEPDVTVAPVTVQVPKSESGETPLEPVGASAIHSALLSAQSEQLWVVEKLLAGLVESVTVSVSLVPAVATEALMLSPGLTDSPTSWTTLLGYISHHV